jgi:hypothetical protein
MAMSDPTPREVSTAIWAVARPLMATDRWCVNAARLCKEVLRELAVPSYPVHAEVIHLNAAAAEQVRPPGSPPPDGYTPPVLDPDQQPYMIYARLSVISRGDIGAEDSSSPDGLPGHVLTYVPSWRCYLDPSAHQFARPEHGVELPPGHVWGGLERVREHGWQRPDGGVSTISPTGLRRFTLAPGWQPKPYHALVAREVIRLLAES